MIRQAEHSITVVMFLKRHTSDFVNVLFFAPRLAVGTLGPFKVAFADKYIWDTYINVSAITTVYEVNCGAFS